MEENGLGEVDEEENDAGEEEVTLNTTPCPLP